MATKRELEEINARLQMRLTATEEENRSLRDSLRQANKQLAQLGERFEKLRAYVQTLRGWASDQLGEGKGG